MPRKKKDEVLRPNNAIPSRRPASTPQPSVVSNDTRRTVRFEEPPQEVAPQTDLPTAKYVPPEDRAVEPKRKVYVRCRCLVDQTVLYGNLRITLVRGKDITLPKEVADSLKRGERVF